MGNLFSQVLQNSIYSFDPKSREIQWSCLKRLEEEDECPVRAHEPRTQERHKQGATEARQELLLVLL